MGRADAQGPIEQTALARTMRGRIEQFAFIDGHQRPEERIHGTEEGFEHLRLEVHEASTAQ